MARLASHIWVSAYLRRLQLADIPAFVLARGDETAGAILVKVNTLNGQAALFQREYDFAQDTTIWRESSRGAENEIDTAINTARQRDRDLWVIEVENRTGQHLLDQPGFV